MGEHASSSGDTAAGKLLWLNRPSFSALADIALVMTISGHSGLHDFLECIVLQGFGSPTLDQSVGVASERRVFCLWQSRPRRCKYLSRPALVPPSNTTLQGATHSQSSEPTHARPPQERGTTQ